MKVVLLKDIKGVGRAREIVDVSEGYAKNLLLPKGFAKLATPSLLKDIKIKIDLEAKEVENLKQVLASLQEETKKNPLILRVKVGSHNEIFGGIHEEDIEKALFSKGYMNLNLDKLERPIKQLGRHKVKIRLGRGIVGEIDIEVRPL